MMTWNYRVFREDDNEYVIREVFYDEDGTILGCTADPIDPVGQSLEELRQTLDDFRAALELPVLTTGELPRPEETSPARNQRPTVRHEDIRSKLGLTETMSKEKQIDRLEN